MGWFTSTETAASLRRAARTGSSDACAIARSDPWAASSGWPRREANSARESSGAQARKQVAGPARRSFRSLEGRKRGVVFADRRERVGFEQGRLGHDWREAVEGREAPRAACMLNLLLDRSIRTSQELHLVFGKQSERCRILDFFSGSARACICVAGGVRSPRWRARRQSESSCRCIAASSRVFPLD